MLLVNELAKQCEVTTDAIRYYTRLGLLKPVRDPDNSYTYYNNSDMKKIKFITMAKHLGYTLNEITQIFQECEKGKSPCPRVREIIQHRIVENRRKIDQTLQLQKHMEKALASWEDMPDGVPDGHTICLLIESFDEN